MKDVYELLNKLDINYAKESHKDIYTIDDANELNLNLDGIGTKSLFLKDCNNYYIYVLNDTKRADFKYLKEVLGTKLKFASDEELEYETKLLRGSVTPFGVINNDKIIVLLDESLKDNNILLAPNINTETISIKFKDLIKMLTYLHIKYIYIK